MKGGRRKGDERREGEGKEGGRMNRKLEGGGNRGRERRRHKMQEEREGETDNRQKYWYMM